MTQSEQTETQRIGLFPLIGIVMGAMIGAGAFNLPKDMAAGSSAGAIIISWTVTGVGMIALAFCFVNIGQRRPDIKGGLFNYANHGFGGFAGALTGWGHWTSAWLGNVSYLVLIFATLGYFFPVFGDGNNLISIICASFFMWGIVLLVLKGMAHAVLINLVVTVGKILPIVVFIAISIIAFNADIFSRDFWGTGGDFDWEQVKKQVTNNMLVTMWVFIGVEGAITISRRAKKHSDVGVATVIGLVSTLVLYVAISLLALGAIDAQELSGLPTPSMGLVLERTVGPWGAVFINIGLLISVVGAFLGWTILCAEIPYAASKEGILPRIFGIENAAKSPMGSLLITNGIVQVFLIIVLVSEGTYRTVFLMSSTASILPYTFAALFQLQICKSKTLYGQNESKAKDVFVGVLALLYTGWLCYAAGLQNWINVIVIFIPVIFLYIWAKRENRSAPVAVVSTE